MVSVNTALAYLKYGWAVIPVHTIVHGCCTCGRDECTVPGKHPRVNWAEYTQRLPNEDEVRSWFVDEFPGTNIGMVTGSVSDILVVDCDGREGAKSARENLDLPYPTLISLTGGGGFHVFYTINKAKIASKRAMFEKVDIKAERGFVVLPPSIHMSGFRYKWFKKYKPVPIDAEQFEAEAENGLTNNDHGWWVELLRDGVDEGERSNALSKLAGRYATRGVDLTFMIYGLKQWNLKNNPPLPEDELVKTAKFIYDKNKAESQSEQITSLKQLDSYIRKFSS